MGKIFSNAITPKMEEVTVGGWVENIRDLGSIVFVILSDREGSLQLTFKEGEVPEEMLEQVKELTPSSTIKAQGQVREAENDFGFEIVPHEIEVNQADAPLPLDIFKETSKLSQRIKWRTLDLRGKDKAIFRVRSLISKAFEEFLRDRGFIKIETPVITSSATEGGADVFEVKYFDRKAYLRQSPQLYKQLMAASLEKVFEVGPAFRAEPSHTRRHLTEYTSLDLEKAWIDGIDELMDLGEDLFSAIFRTLQNEGQQYFEELGTHLPEPPSSPPRLKYKEVAQQLRKRGIEIEGKELSSEGERVLGEMIKEQYDSKFLWITDYPWETRPFYHMKKEGDLTKSFDLLFRGMEVITGSQREHRSTVLKSQMKEKGLTPENFGYYLRSFKYGIPPHGGFACGLARITTLVLELGNVREATLFPRDPETLEP